MTTSKIDREPIAPSQNELRGLAGLHRLLQECRADELALVNSAGERVALPESAVRVLRQALDALKRNQVVVVRRMMRDLTVSEAADLLGVPDDAVRRLVAEDVLPSCTAQGLRTLRFEDVMAHKQERATARRRVLDEMTRESQELAALVD
jgi:excisionase family DNA binding protein